MSNCSKYEEGPIISLKTKKSRLVNKWKLDKVYIDGVDEGVNGQDPSELDIWIEFKKDGSYEDSANGSGTWEFDEIKENIELFNINSDLIAEYRIIKLKESELWLEYELKTGNNFEDTIVIVNHYIKY